MLHEPSVLVGFGLTGDQTGIDYRTQPRLQKRDLDITGLGPDSLAVGVTTVPPRALIMKGASGCIGDSGGPLLAQSTGAVLGVYSLQVGESCVAPDVRHQMVHVPPFVTLIDEAFAAAGCLPTPEPEFEPTAAAGATGSAGAGADGDSNGAGGNPSEAGAPSAEPERDPKPKADTNCAFTRLPAVSLSAFDALALLLGVGVVQRRSRRRERG